MKRITSYIKISDNCYSKSRLPAEENYNTQFDRALANSWSKNLFYAMIFLLVVIIPSNSVVAATKTWTGATNTDWTLGSNWGGTAPVAGDDILIPGGLSNYPIISTSVSIKSINLNNTGSGATLSLITGGSLTVSDKLTINATGTFTMQDGLASIGELIISGDLNIQGGTITTDKEIVVNGTLTQSGGIVWLAINTSTDPEYNLKISGGTVNQSGGTITTKDYDISTGTFNQTGAGALFRIFKNWKPDSGHTFNSTNGTVRFSDDAEDGGDFKSTGTQFHNILVDSGSEPGFSKQLCNIKISGNFTNNNTDLTVENKATFTFNGTGNQEIYSASTGTNTTFGHVIINNTGGTVSLSSDITGISGNLTLNAGSVLDLDSYSFGSSTPPASLTMEIGSTGASISGTGTLTLGGNVTVNATSGSDGATISAPVALGATRTFTVADDGTSATDLTISGIISGAFGLTKAGSGTMTLSGSNSYTGLTTISSGTLLLGAADCLADTGPISLNGGTFKTGATTGNSETLGTLNLTENSTIALGTGVHSLSFAASNGISWTSGKIITITGWTGAYNGTSGTSGKIFVGNSLNGLSVSQLSQISFFDGISYFPATILTSGEVVPSNTTPAGVTGATLWLKADAGTSTYTEGSNVTLWQDNSGAFNNATTTNNPGWTNPGINPPLYRTGSSTLGMNFNPSVDFAADKSLDGIAGFSTRQVFIVFKNATTGNTVIGFDDPDGGGGRLQSTLSYRVDQITLSARNTSDGNYFSTYVSHTLPSSQALLTDGQHLTSTTGNVFVNGGGSSNISNSGTPPSPYTGAYRLNKTSNDQNPADAQISEVISFNSNLSATDQLKVRSYLSLKYGITLDQNVAQDYLASDGTTIYWDGSTNSSYINNIAGIAFDETSTLEQKQSRSVNAGLQVVIGNGNSIAASNFLNTSTFSVDKSALVWGDDGGSVAAWTSTGAPAGSQIVARTWKVQETGTLDSVKVQIADDSGTNGLPAEGTSILYLLVDADGNFASGAIPNIMTLNGTNWETNVDFNDGQFFTFAAAPPIELSTTQTNIICNGASTGAIDLTVTAGMAPYNYSWTASNGGIVPGGQATNQDLTALVAGTYTVVVTETGGNTEILDVTITQPDAMSLSATNTPVFPEGSSTGVIDLTVVGGNTPYNYSWTASLGGVVPGGQATNQDLTTLVAGTYTVIVTDACLATAILPVDIFTAATKQLYLSSPGQSMDRVDPVATGDNTTAQSLTLSADGFTQTVDLIAIKDNYIQKKSTGTNNGSCTSLTVDRESGDLQRALFQFDLSSIPTNASITSAELRLNCTNGPGGMSVSVFQIGASDTWDEGSSCGSAGQSNWTQSTSSTNWSGLGILGNDPGSGTPVATINVSSSGIHSWPITSLVQNWFSGTTNNGIVVGSQDGGGDRTAVYDSRESSGTKPALRVTYVLPPSPTTSFTQATAFCSDFTIKFGPVSVTSYINLLEGSMPADPSITAELKYGTTPIITLSNPTYNSGLLTWTGYLASDVTIPSGQAITLDYNTTQSAVSFNIEHDSETKPSNVQLLTSDYIGITSHELYDAPYPGGSVISTPISIGTTVYARTVVTDPFGSDDINGLDIIITPPGSTESSVSVATTTCTRTFEYVWNTAGLFAGSFTLPATAKEGYEDVYTDVHPLNAELCTPFANPIFTIGASSSRCQEAGTETYTATATSSTQITYTLDATSLAGGNSINATTGEVTFVEEWLGTSTITASVPTCSGVETTIHTVNTVPYEWTGAVSTDWNDAGNWSCGLIPDFVTDVYIPDVANKPVLSSGSIGESNNIAIELGSSLTVIGNTMQISGTITNNGTFIATDGTIEMIGTVAQIIGTDIFDGNTIENLIINNNAGVTLQGPLGITGIVTLTAGNFSSAGNLTLVSTATQTALIEGSGAGSVIGNVTMQRYLANGFGYKYFSSPFQDATVGEFSDDMNLASSFPLFYRYDESRTSSGWVAYTTASDPLNSVEGYAINFGSDVSPNTVDVTGTVNNGSLSATLYNNHNTYTDGFNLVGNPYPSPIDWDAASGWTKTNVDDGIYYFLPSTTDQYGGTYSSYVGGISSDGEATNIIPSMQGFFVHVSDGAYPVTATLGVDNNVRIVDLTHPFLKSKQDDSRFLLRLAVGFTNDSQSSDPMVIYFDDQADEGFDSKLDALKLINTDLNVPNLYTLIPGGAKLSINALPEMTDTNMIVPLGLTTYKSGEISFSIRDIVNLPQNMNIYLNDAVAGINYNLLPDNEYKINISNGTYLNRFTLGFEKINITDVFDIESSTDIFNVYSSNGIVKANIGSLKNREGTIFLFDILGHQIFMKKIFEEGFYEFNTQVKPGIYVFTLVTGNVKHSRQIFINNR